MSSVSEQGLSDSGDWRGGSKEGRDEHFRVERKRESGRRQLDNNGIQGWLTTVNLVLVFEKNFIFILHKKWCFFCGRNTFILGLE